MTESEERPVYFLDDRSLEQQAEVIIDLDQLEEETLPKELEKSMQAAGKLFALTASNPDLKLAARVVPIYDDDAAALLLTSDEESDQGFPHDNKMETMRRPSLQQYLDNQSSDEAEDDSAEGDIEEPLLKKEQKLHRSHSIFHSHTQGHAHPPAQHSHDSSHNSQSSSEEDEATCCQRVARRFRIIICAVPSYSLQVADAGIDAVQTVIGLRRISKGLSVPVALINFASTLGLNIHFGVSGSEDSWYILSHLNKPQKLPPRWNQDPDGNDIDALANLGKAYEVTALATSMLLTSLAVSADSVQAYFFMMSLPSELSFEKFILKGPWKAFSIGISLLEGLQILTSEGVSNYRSLREFFARIPRGYRNPASKYVTGTFGRVLGVGDSLNDAALSYVGLKFIINFQSTPAMCAVAAWSLAAGIPNYSTNGVAILEHLDNFIGSFTPDCHGVVQAKQPKNIAALILASGAGGIFAYAFKNMLEEELANLSSGLAFVPTTAATVLVEVLAYWGMTSTFVNSTGNLYPVAYKAVELLAIGLGKLKDKCWPTNNAALANDGSSSSPSTSEEGLNFQNAENDADFLLALQTDLRRLEEGRLLHRDSQDNNGSSTDEFLLEPGDIAQEFHSSDLDDLKIEDGATATIIDFSDPGELPAPPNNLQGRLFSPQNSPTTSTKQDSAADKNLTL